MICPVISPLPVSYPTSVSFPAWTLCFYLSKQDWKLMGRVILVVNRKLEAGKWRMPCSMNTYIHFKLQKKETSSLFPQVFKKLHIFPKALAIQENYVSHHWHFLPVYVWWSIKKSLGKDIRICWHKILTCWCFLKHHVHGKHIGNITMNSLDDLILRKWQQSDNLPLMASLFCLPF